MITLLKVNTFNLIDKNVFISIYFTTSVCLYAFARAPLATKYIFNVVTHEIMTPPW